MRERPTQCALLLMIERLSIARERTAKVESIFIPYFFHIAIVLVIQWSLSSDTRTASEGGSLIGKHDDAVQVVFATTAGSIITAGNSLPHIQC